MQTRNVPKATLGRLPSYLKYLNEIKDECKTVSATTISKALGLGEVQVRKDLGTVSGEGKPKIGYVTEDRKTTGLILGQTIRFNISMASLKKVLKNGVLSKKKEKEVVTDLKKRLQIKTNNIENPVSSLSGGNQQKVVLAKWLATAPRVLILDEPTRGVDVGARYEIYTIIKELAQQGNTIIMISSDLPEVIGMSDRVYAMYEGKVHGELQKEEINEDAIMRYITGVA